MSPHPDESLNANPEENRALAAAFVTTLRDLQATLLETATGIGKWILTSLLAINGAAAIATWNSTLEVGPKLAASGLFIAGILAALLCGAFQIRQVTRVAKPLGNAIGYWISVQADGLRSAELEDFAEIEATTKKTALIWIFGVVSVLLFLGGAGVAGHGISNPSKVAQCQR